MPPDIALAHELASLTGLVLSGTDDSGALREVGTVAERVLPHCDGVPATMREQGRASSSASTDAWAEELDRLQLVVQEGPCLNCMREGAVLRVRDFAADGRFPTYGPPAADRGAASTVSIPLNADGRTVGALNFYSRKADAFDDDDVAVCLLVGAHAELRLQAAYAFLSAFATLVELSLSAATASCGRSPSS